MLCKQKNAITRNTFDSLFFSCNVKTMLSIKPNIAPIKAIIEIILELIFLFLFILFTSKLLKLKILDFLCCSWQRDFPRRVNTSLRVLLRRICVPGRVQLTIQIRVHPRGALNLRRSLNSHLIVNMYPPPTLFQA